MALILFILLIGLPIAEIALFIKASAVIGWWSVIGLTILTAVLGTALIRVQGFQALHNLRGSMADGKAPVEPVVDGVFLLIAAPLMMTPGFLTDTIGFLLLVPPVRHEIARYALRRLRRAVDNGNIRVVRHQARLGKSFCRLAQNRARMVAARFPNNRGRTSMSETPPNDQQPTSDQPVMRAMSQYLKDLSFESPGAPQSLMSNLPAPEVEVGVDVNARRVGPDQYEVELACNATSTRDGETVFVVETNYAGLFLIQNVPDDQMEPLLLVEAPRLLFPFARQIVASATKEGGFPPLMLEPLDFAGMYRMQRARAAEGAMPNGNA